MLPMFLLAGASYMFIKVAHNFFQSFLKWNSLTHQSEYMGFVVCDFS